MSGTQSTANAKSTNPPGPANFVRSTMTFQRSPLDFLGGLFDSYGDVCSFRLATTKIVALRHPRDIKRVLQQKYPIYNRSAAAHKMARNLFGNGLSMAVGGAEWRSRRRLMQPSFHYQRVATMSEHMLAVIQEVLERWDTLAARQEAVDTGEEMRRLTLRIVARALFALEDETVTNRFAAAVDEVDRELTAYMQLPLLPLSVPTASHRRFWASLHVIEEIIDYVIVEHLEDRVDRGDLLSMLIQTVDEDTGERLPEKDLRDEVFNLLFAGHETSANVLTWVWYRLGLHPDVQNRIQQEIDHELDGRPPTLADCSRLVYTRCVIDETVRMYPQQWQGWRRAIEDDEIGGFRIPAGTDIFFSPYHMHRHQDFWEDPESFQPERFNPEETARRDRSCYIPFGSGPHLCIGKEFAMAEMLLIVASTVQRYRVELASRATIAAKPLITLGPERPVQVRLEPRTRTAG